MDWLPFIGTLSVGGIIGGITTQLMTSHRERVARTVQYRKQQLEEFYGPLLAAHKEIRARGELRVKLQEAIDSSHAEGMLFAGANGVEAASDAHTPAILANIRDEGDTMRNVLMPRYREMITTFRERCGLQNLRPANISRN